MQRTLSHRLASVTPKRYAGGKRYAFRRNTYGPGWVFSIQLGRGAGYCIWSDDRTRQLVTGRTFYVAWRSGSRRYAQRRPSRLPLEAGLTRNANRVPYASS